MVVNQATLMVKNPTNCNIELIVRNIHRLIVGLVEIGSKCTVEVIMA